MSKNEETKYVDQLTPDAPILGQLWTCISFLSPEGIRNCSVRGLKIRGVFATRDEAEAYAKELSGSDIFHVFVGEVGKWLPWDPDPNDAEDQVYQEEELQRLMHAYKQNQEKAKKMQQQRKSDMIETSTQDENIKSHNAQRMRKKLEERKQRKKLEEQTKLTSNGPQVPLDDIVDGLSDISNTSNKKDKGKKSIGKKKIGTGSNNSQITIEDSELEKKEKMANMEKSRLQETKKDMNDKKEALDSIDSQLEKIHALYSKLHEKKSKDTSNAHNA